MLNNNSALRHTNRKMKKTKPVQSRRLREREREREKRGKERERREGGRETEKEYSRILSVAQRSMP
jgi:hypothetical protein